MDGEIGIGLNLAGWVREHIRNSLKLKYHGGETHSGDFILFIIPKWDGRNMKM